MEITNHQPPATVYIYTGHPLVFAVLQASVQSHSVTSYTVCDFQITNGHFDKNRPSALVIDTCTVSAWPELSSTWRLHGIRTIILLPTPVSQEEELRLLCLGIHGIIYVSMSLDQQLVPALDSVLNGNLWVNRGVLAEYVKRTVPSFREPSSSSTYPTMREEQVIALLRKGFSNKMIADILNISERTVKFHVSNVFQKCHVGSRRAFLTTKEDQVSSLCDRQGNSAEGLLPTDGMGLRRKQG